MNPKLRIAVPLSLAVVLTVLFVFLLLSEQQRPAGEEEPGGLPQRPVARE